MLASLLLPLTMQGSVLAMMNDQQLCEAISSNIDAFEAPLVAPATASRVSSDCRSKRINAVVTLSISGAQFDAYVAAFLGAARSGVCNLADPTMATFHERGWRMAYRFEALDGSAQDHVLNC